MPQACFSVWVYPGWCLTCILGLYEVISELFYSMAKSLYWIFQNAWPLWGEKKFSTDKSKCLSWAIKMITSVALSHVNAVRKIIQPPIYCFSPCLIMDDGSLWIHEQMVFISRLSACFLLTHRPFPSSSMPQILSALCWCVSMSLSLYVVQLTAQCKMA